MTLRDSFSLAYRTVRSNKLRTGITVAIIAFGIMALIGIITAIDAMNGSLRESFSTMGANGFTVRFKERTLRIGNGGGREMKFSRKNARKQKTMQNDHTKRPNSTPLFSQKQEKTQEQGKK